MVRFWEWLTEMGLDVAEYDVVLLPSFAQVEDWRKRRANACEAGLFSQVVTTFNAWMADLWELHGDGRAIVDSLQRQTVMQAAFEQLAFESEMPAELLGDEGEESAIGTPIGLESAVGADAAELPATASGALEGPVAPAGEGDSAPSEPGREDGDALTVSPGLIVVAARCVRQAAGVPAFERAVDEVQQGRLPAGLSVREAVLLRGIARYRGLLVEAQLVELGQAASFLASEEQRVFARPLRVLVAQTAPLGWQAASFFSACSRVQVIVEEAPGAGGIECMPEGCALRFGFPSGRYAQPALVADLVREALVRADGAEGAEPLVVVTCKDPLALYKSLEPEFARLGVRGCVQAQVPFASTDFGRQFLSLARAVHEGAWSKDDLSDAVQPPYSGFGRSDAIKVDKELRANRLAQRDECLERLSAASDTFSQFVELASDPDADVLLGVFEQAAWNAPGRSPAWRAEQLGAASALRACTSAARSVGATMQACVRVLRDVKVTASYEGVRAGDAQHRRVLVTAQEAAAQMGEGSCDVLVLADLTSEDYPVADKDDAASTLFAKIGLLPADSALARARRTFTALQRLPRRQVVCLRPLNDWDGNPTYPAAVLQELVDAYREDATSDDDLDDVFGLPGQLMESLVQRGEEMLFANAQAAAPTTIQAVECAVAQAGPGAMADFQVAHVALPRRAADGRVLPGFSPSPSQVETYLECPYKWFVQNRLKAEGLDEGFGPIERGSFSHAVLQRFYARFAEAGQRKVNADNLAQAKELLRTVADEVEAEQYEMAPGSGRYVAANQIEQRELEACKEQLVSYLDFEARFLPSFHPEYLEYAIGPEDGVRYAGHAFIGTVDRIDVDDAGNAVIVDYKGSLTGAHDIAGKGFADPGKVQTRMYAQAIKRELGLNIVGALYVSYGKTHACSGAFDGRVLEAAHLPAMRHERCCCAVADPVQGLIWDDFAQLSFSRMLDETELVVERAIARMQAGDVEPNPATPDTCRYCPAANCPKRGA